MNIAIAAVKNYKAIKSFLFSGTRKERLSAELE
jgi:hypothetical protein